MLTFKRAIIIAAAVLTFIFLLRSAHSDIEPIHNADLLPKPKGVNTRGRNDDQQTALDKPAPPQQSSTSWASEEPPPPPQRKKPKMQISMEDLRSKPLRDQLEYQFPYDPTSKFPAYIWQTWKYTPSSGQFDEAFREPEASWTMLHPTFVHEVITDDVAVHLLRHLYASVPEVMEAYQALPFAVMKADFFRYLILLARGGIYSDIDTSALKSATEWVPSEVSRSSYGMVIGIEADPDRPDWAEWYSRRIQFCQWTIQAKPGHPILRDIVARITEETLKRKAEGKLSKTYKNIVDETGPALWTDLIFKFFNDPEYFDMSTSKGNITWEHFTGMKTAKKVGDVVVLPITSFSPGVRTMGAGEDDDPMAFVKHRFEGTWKPEAERHIGENN
ncbi:glycosyltransferase family 32 protein [Venturia nashicola]|nr:glycosyltransferase family 32 protein [Venturia nashicola]